MLSLTIQHHIKAPPHKEKIAKRCLKIIFTSRINQSIIHVCTFIITRCFENCLCGDVKHNHVLSVAMLVWGRGQGRGQGQN